MRHHNIKQFKTEKEIKLEKYIKHLKMKISKLQNRFNQIYSKRMKNLKKYENSPHR